MAALNYHSANGRFATGLITIDADVGKFAGGTNLWVEMLPYIEETNLKAKWDYDDYRNNIAGGHQALSAQVLPIFVCPSDPLPVPRSQLQLDPPYEWMNGLYGLGSYGGNAGTRSFGNSNVPQSEDGVFFTRSRVRMAMITDGASYTVLFGERSHEDSEYDRLSLELDPSYYPLTSWGAWCSASHEFGSQADVLFGSIVPINYRVSPQPNRGYEASRWTESGGIVGLGDLPGGSFESHAHAVSADNSVIVGSGISASGLEAIRWRQTGGMIGLGDLPGGSFGSVAYDVSADGSVVVGQGNSTSGAEAFRWTPTDAMTGLGDLPGGEYSSRANGVSADGSVITGTGSSATSAEAFLWDATHGMRSLRDVLVNEFGLGAILAGWTLTSANNISSDGQFIVGKGTNPNGNTEAWPARLAPMSPGDFNNDGAVDVADYVVWRKTNGTQAGYDQWRANFGTSLGVSSAAGSEIVGATGSASASAVPISATIPEPAGIALAAGGFAGWIACLRRRK